MRLHKLAWILFGLSFAACSGQQFYIPPEDVEFGQSVTYNKEVDVLFVVDNSNSMAVRQDFLSQQIPTFIQALDQTGLDYQIGVTTMDMRSSGAAGRFIAQTNTPRFLRKETPNLIPLLMGRIKVGESGSPVERGLEAMLRALELSRPQEHNAGFLRPQALLNIIVLSDEEDQSDSSINYSNRLTTLRPPLASGERSWLVHFLGVLPNDPRCRTADWDFSSPGMRYIGLASESGGSAESICDANFERALSNVRARILEIQTEFKLGRKPNESSILVKINGLAVPKNSANGWSYRADTNSIRFHGSYIPKGQDRIQVTFDPAELK